MVPNYLWYIGLLLISSLVFIIAFIKHNNKIRLLQTYFFISGLSYFTDFLVLVLLDGYQYKPNLVPPLWFDSTYGSIFSQAFTVPIAATVIAGFNLGLFSIVSISIGFMGLEELFLSLDLYEQHWWKTWYTGLLLPFGFYFAKFWYNLLEYPLKITKFITIYMTLVVYTNTLRFFMVLLFSTHMYSVGWFDDPIRDHIAANALFLFLFMILVTLVVTFRFSVSWIFGLLAMEWLLNYTLIQSGVISLAPYWSSFYFVVLLFSTVIIFRLLYIKWFPLSVTCNRICE